MTTTKGPADPPAGLFVMFVTSGGSGCSATRSAAAVTAKRRRPMRALVVRSRDAGAVLTELLPRRADYAGLRKGWRRDAVAGLTVAVVALPLALAFGVTTGVGASAGLTTAIVAGLVAALLGGSSYQVSGPTGAMTVVLVPIVARYGPEAVPSLALLAGAIVVVAAVARVGRLLAYLPWPVVEGFTVGIALIIAVQQVPTALGVDRPEGENAVAVAARAVWAARDGLSAQAVALTAVAAALMVLVPRLHRSAPASLLAVAAVTLMAEIGDMSVGRIGALPHGLSAPVVPDLGMVRALVGPAFAVAALAAIESLLSAKVADGMADDGRHDPDRELFGQGAASAACAFFGGMPATGAIARTAVNVRSGARTRVAAIVHALALLGIVLTGASLVARIPLAALAGVLAVTAVRMVERHNVLAVLRSTRSDAAVLIATSATTLVFDLIVAVEVGIVLAAFLALRQVALTSTTTAESLNDVEVDAEDEHRLLDEHVLVYRLDGALFFGAAQRFLTEMTEVADIRVVILRLAQLQVLDATGAQALGDMVRQLENRGITVLLKGLRPQHERILRAVGALDRLADGRHVFDELEPAIAHARRHVRREMHEQP